LTAASSLVDLGCSNVFAKLLGEGPGTLETKVQLKLQTQRVLYWINLRKEKRKKFSTKVWVVSK
jgi:hypothetical protein